MQIILPSATYSPCSNPKVFDSSFQVADFDLKTFHQKSMKKRKRSDLVECVFPVDIGLKIVSSLEAADMFSLASCSRFWREGWRELYVKKHKDVAAELENKLSYYLQQISSFGLVEGSHYLEALQDLNAIHLPFKEVESLFFNPNIHVLVKLVAMHYCILHLWVPVKSVMEVLRRCNLINKRVCIRWSKAKKCRGFCHFVTCSFGDLLRCGHVHDLNFIGITDFNSALQVQISVA